MLWLDPSIAAAQSYGFPCAAAGRAGGRWVKPNDDGERPLPAVQPRSLNAHEAPTGGARTGGGKDEEAERGNAAAAAQIVRSLRGCGCLSRAARPPPCPNIARSGTSSIWFVRAGPASAAAPGR